MEFMKQQQDRLEELYALSPGKIAELEAAQVEANKERWRISGGSQEVPKNIVAFHNILEEARSMKQEIKQLEKSVSYEYKVWAGDARGDMTYTGLLVAPRKLVQPDWFIVEDKLFEVVEDHQDKGLLYVVALGTAKTGRWKEGGQVDASES